jgi:pimeloyl-ACP methyl ester carboxylesterase
MLQARTVGPERAASVVFVHGGGVAGWAWREQVQGLPDFHCIVPDLPGHGGSRSRPWAGITDAAARVAELIRERAHGGHAHLVGLSLGSHVALQLLADHPELVDRVLVSGTLVTGLPGARVLAGLATLMLPLARTGWMTALSARSLHVPKADLVAHREEAPLTADLLRHMVLDVSRYRPPTVLATRPHPVLVLAGTREHRRVRASVAVLTALLPHATGGLVTGAIHTWNWQRPDAFTRAIRGWLLEERAPADLRPA